VAERILGKEIFTFHPVSRSASQSEKALIYKGFSDFPFQAVSSNFIWFHPRGGQNGGQKLARKIE
jgi:hypothetical protein